MRFLTFEDRPSSSPFIERVWRCHSGSGGVFYSMAEGNCELVVTRLEGLTLVTLRGPVTKARPVLCPANGRWFAIRFRMGVYFPRLPALALMDHKDIDFPTTANGRFWFEGKAWEIPGFSNAEVFVGRLARAGAIALESTIPAAIEGDDQLISRRSVQRRFVRVTGMTHARLRQIERARYAVKLLRAGSPILDVVQSASYFDQAHLTRSLQQFVGQTPAALLRNDTQLSFSYESEVQVTRAWKGVTRIWAPAARCENSDAGQNLGCQPLRDPQQSSGARRKLPRKAGGFEIM